MIFSKQSAISPDKQHIQAHQARLRNQRINYLKATVDLILFTLQALATLCVKLSIDDFGTDYSSLNYLKRFPLNKLKIDRSFVQETPDNDSDVVICTAMINLSRAVNLKVIAEGVEIQAQKTFLSNAGCNEMQGYFFSPAIPADDFEKLL